MDKVVFVKVVDIETFEEVKRLGPYNERDADRAVRGLLRQINRDRYFVAQEYPHG